MPVLILHIVFTSYRKKAYKLHPHQRAILIWIMDLKEDDPNLQIHMGLLILRVIKNILGLAQCVFILSWRTQSPLKYSSPIYTQVK